MDEMDLNTMRKLIIDEVAEMRKQRMILVMHKELGEMLLQKSKGKDYLEDEVLKETEKRVAETIDRINGLDELIKMGEMALKIHELLEE